MKPFALKVGIVGKGGGALFAIAIMLLLSGALRFSSGVSQAVALEFEKTTESQEAVDKNMRNESEPGIAEALAAIREREERVTVLEAQLEKRLKAIDLSESIIDEKLRDLVEAEERLRGTIALANSAAEDDLIRLTAVYENMKPKDAAVLFEAMSPEFAAGFLGRMRADAAAAVMAGLEPETAYSISVLLAGRNAAVPTE
jgi:flagellar motility protein MotE (MotC chaperone)